ncbi:MAG: diguanylate cyclase [Thermoanaerobaculia bacterium]
MSDIPEARPGRQFEILATIARLATEDLELRPMMQRVTDALAALFGWEFVALVRIDAARRRFICEAVTTTVASEVRPGYSRDLGSGVVGEVAARGLPTVIDDVDTVPGYVETLPGCRSELCVPVRHRGEVVAVLNLESTRIGAFRGQLHFVEVIAGHVAGAIASAQHLESTRRRAEHFEILSEVSATAVAADEIGGVLERIAAFVQQRFDFFLVSILVPDEEGREWAHRATAVRSPAPLARAALHPAQVGVVGRAIRTGEPQLVQDVTADPDYFQAHPAVVSEYVVPIRFGGQVIGAFNVESDRPEAFPPELCSLLDLIAAQVAGAIRLALLNRRLADATGELETANRALEWLSQSDPLTGLANRRRFDEVLVVEWRRLARSGLPLALLLIDVDCFKAYNDSRGHPAGDVCLQRVARAFSRGVHRAGDLVARYGGEEFALVLPDLDREGALALAERLRATIEGLAEPHPASPVAAVVTISAGVAVTVPDREAHPGDLVAAADRALYAAKQAGRNRVEVAD